jgi:hypothetical protein
VSHLFFHHAKSASPPGFLGSMNAKIVDDCSQDAILAAPLWIGLLVHSKSQLPETLNDRHGDAALTNSQDPASMSSFNLSILQAMWKWSFYRSLDLNLWYILLITAIGVGLVFGIDSMYKAIRKRK